MAVSTLFLYKFGTHKNASAENTGMTLWYAHLVHVQSH